MTIQCKYITHGDFIHSLYHIFICLPLISYHSLPKEYPICFPLWWFYIWVLYVREKSGICLAESALFYFNMMISNCKSNFYLPDVIGGPDVMTVTLFTRWNCHFRGFLLNMLTLSRSYWTLAGQFNSLVLAQNSSPTDSNWLPSVQLRLDLLWLASY